MTRGEARHGSGRESSIGRRLRVGAVGTIAIGGAIVMGGAATLVTAFANTGGVAVSQNCTTWTASARLDDNVNNRLVTVTSTIPGVPGYSQVISTDGTHGSTLGPVTIVDKTGAAPQSGSITETIYNSDVASSGVDQTYSATLPAPSNCNSLISTTPSAGGVVGTAIHDSATVTGTLGSPAGSVVFALFPPTDTNCTGTALHTFPAVSLTSTTPGTSTASSPAFTTTAVGTYHWVAAYGGSSIYKSATSNCADEAAVISQGGPSISTTAAQGGSAPFAVSDSATLTGGVNPTGSVTFNLYADANCATRTASLFTSTVQLPATAPFTVSSGNSPALSTPGKYQWIASYSGDANNASATSACGDEPVTIGSGPQGITTSVPPTPSTGDTGSLTGVTLGGFLLLGGLGTALLGSMLPRRRRSQ